MTRLITNPTGPVYALQNMLRSISEKNINILPVIPDGIYGPHTFASVRSFQFHFGLEPTGVVNYHTWTTIAAEYHKLKPYQLYQSDLAPSDLMIFQVKLKHLMKQILSEDLIIPAIEYEPATMEAIKWLQRKSGLNESGYADVETQYALDGLYRNSLIL